MKPSRAVFGTQFRLLRDFIADSLYNLQYGYFSKQAPVGFLNPPIDFSTLPSRAAYFAEVQRRYTALQVAWLTPTEIFSPHFGASIARYLTTQHLSNSNTVSSTNNNNFKASSTSTNTGNENAHPPLIIYELGGGTGTLARDILNWLKQYAPKVHATCQYTCIEISPTLAELQYTRVVVEQGGVHEHQFQVVRGDAAEIETWEKETIDRRENVLSYRMEGEPCFVVAMEVLDNLPHDKVIYSTEKTSAGNTFSSSTRDEGNGGRWLEASVAESFGNTGDKSNSPASLYKEIYTPVNDPLIHRCLQTWLEREATTRNEHELSSFLKSIFQKIIDVVAVDGGVGTSRRHGIGSSAIFLPTGALRLFDTLHKVRPNHRLLAADFDFLPETVIQGENAPLVATTIDGVTKDYGSYLVQPGVADIFFPSDFELLARLYDQRCKTQSRSGVERGVEGGGGGARYMKSKDFFEKWAEVDVNKKRRKTRCRDGYDPLLEDYSNTAFLVS